MLDTTNLSGENAIFIGTIIGSAISGIIITYKGYKAGRVKEDSNVSPLRQSNLHLDRIESAIAKLESTQEEIRESILKLATEVQIIRALIEFRKRD